MAAPCPEIVQPDRWQAGLLDQLAEPVSHDGRVQPLAVLLGEDPAGLDPRSAPLLAVGSLPLAMGLQHRHCLRVEGDRPGARVGLGVVLVNRPAIHDELLGHREELGLQVGVGSPLTARLAAAEAPEGDEVEQRVDSVAGGLVKEGAGLLRRSDHR